jgi:uncharacterized protein
VADELKQRIQDDVKAAMRARDRTRLETLRMVTAAIKQQEVDRREVLDDGDVLAVLDKMLKQRRDSLEQFRTAGRDDLADKEAFEIGIIEAYMPAQLDDEQIDQLVMQAIREAGASSVKEMGKVMRLLKARVQARADMGEVSARVRQHLSTDR